MSWNVSENGRVCVTFEDGRTSLVVEISREELVAGLAKDMDTATQAKMVFERGGFDAVSAYMDAVIEEADASIAKIDDDEFDEFLRGL